MQPFPPQVIRICRILHARPLLITHLRAVHRTAARLVGFLQRRLPGLVVDEEAVLFGAAIHDIGKVRHPLELSGRGTRHEDAGPELLEHHGVQPAMARFARTHGRWATESVGVEDLLVAWADHLSRGARNSTLEQVITERLAEMKGIAAWQAWLVVDDAAEAAF